jgi:tetratricopeptide (TPR) repeat protein
LQYFRDLIVKAGLQKPSPFVNRTTKTYLLLLSLVVLLIGCTTKKDGFAYRAYHNTTAHFNGHFNSNENMKKGQKKLADAQVEDYDLILPIFIYGTDETAKSAYPEMEKSIEKSEKVIRRHTIKDEGKKEKKHPEFNKWIDENYMLVGQAHFYKRNYGRSEEVFQFVTRKYKGPAAQITAHTWLARTLIAKEDYSRALQMLNRVEPDGDIPEDLKADYFLVFADLYLHQDKLENAAEKMEEALKHIEKKKDRARPHFILAQIYAQLNKSTEAALNYDMVLKSHPPYELAFYSKINKALSYNRRGGSSDEIKKELMKMLRDEKNKSYRDQIYYALGDVALEEQQRDQAIFYFEESLKANKDNAKQRAKTFLRLADLYFDQRQYQDAQAAYDSTFKRIDEKHPRYREIKARAESLNELVKYINTIELNDSLIVLCAKSDAEIEKALEEAVRQKQQEADAKREADERAAQEAAANAASTGGISGTFWCYNQQLRDKGKQNFTATWGDRPLKDNWRLQSRLSQSFGSPDESQITASETTTNESGEIIDPYKVPTADELRAQLPCGNDAKMKEAVVASAEAYYQLGVIYKENLDDEDNAISSWELLIKNMEESDFHPVTHYQLFRTWLSKEQLSNYKKNPFCGSCDSKYWASQIKERYPNSEWSKLVDNPEYLDMKEIKEKEEREAYEMAYRTYADRNYPEVITLCTNVINTQPENHLLCKYRLLRAVCVGYTDAAYGIKENYQKELNAIKDNCGGSDEAKRAEELLKALVQEGAPSAPEEPKKDESGDQSNPTPPLPTPEITFTFEEGAEHYFAVVMPIQGTDVNKTKANIADFNTENFASAALKVTNNLLDKNQHIILVKPFKGMALAQDYMGAFTGGSSKLADINSAGYTMFLISKQNYIALFKSKNLEGYLQFYNSNY